MEENQVHIPDGWTEDSLGSILDYEQPYRYTVDSTEYDDRSGIPVLTAGKSFILGYTTEQHNVYKNTPVVIFDDFTTDSKFVDFPFKVKSSAMKFLKPKKPDEFDIKIIFGHLQNLKFRETGGDHKRRWISEFSKLRIVLPPSTEQTQIATILAKVDGAIVQTEQLIAKYTRIKKGLMQDLLTKGIDEHGNIRSEETHEFKDSPLGRIPKEWDVSPLNQLCELIVDCKNRTSPFVEKSEFPVIRTSNIKEGNLIWEDMKYTDSNSYKIWTDRAIPVEDDVIITREAPLGQVLKIPSGITPILGQRTMLFRLDKAKLLPDFLVNSILTEKMQMYLNSLSGGSTVHHLKVGDVKTILIQHPKSPIEQQKIQNVLINKDKLIASLKENLSKLQSLKTGLMQDLLSGRVRVNHLIRETASV